MRGLTRRWIRRHDVEAGVDGHLFDRLLRWRGLDDPAERQRFLEPRLSDLHDPRSMMGLERAAARIAEALRKGAVIDLVVEPTFHSDRGGSEVIAAVKDARIPNEGTSLAATGS